MGKESQRVAEGGGEVSDEKPLTEECQDSVPSGSCLIHTVPSKNKRGRSQRDIFECDHLKTQEIRSLRARLEQAEVRVKSLQTVDRSMQNKLMIVREEAEYQAHRAKVAIEQRDRLAKEKDAVEVAPRKS